MSETLEDKVNHPNHYCKFNVELESIDVVDCFCFNLGSCIKYALRYRDKDNPVLDLKKSLFYANRINSNSRKRNDALYEISNYRTVLIVFKEKSKDAETVELIDKLLDCIYESKLDGLINLLEERLNKLNNAA